MSFGSPMPIVRAAAEAFKPPRRISVSKGAAETLNISQPGGYEGMWSPDEAPYMVEPMDMLASRRHAAVCFVGPSRTGKTMGLLDGWLSHCVCHDIGDMLIVQMTQEKARDYSKTRIDRAIRYSPRLAELMSARGHDDNTYDKLFRHGMWVKIGWPSSSQLSGSDYRYVGITDYDRMPDDIDGEGSAFTLGLKRTTTFMTRGMCMVESSPGRDIVDPHWKPSRPHEAPPVNGVLGIYNTSDRRRWYWRCPDCAEWFEAAPGLRLFATLPKQQDLLEIVRTADLVKLSQEHARIACPHCATLIGQEHRPALNAAGRWVPEGQTIESSGELVGQPLTSNIAGFWLGGAAAAYQKWDSLILGELQGLQEFALSGSTATLKSKRNTDQGIPFLSPALEADTEQTVQDRKDDRLQRFFVPPWARFLVGQADVQGGVNGRFVCEVRAFGSHLESCLVDRFELTTTVRDGQPARVDPAGYPEDWDLLTARLVNATYRIADGREMRLIRVGVDAYGEAGVTPNAYAWYRRLRRANLSARVRLLKGASEKPERPMVRSNARSNTGQPMHDMPIWLVDTEYYKDAIAANLRRRTPGPGYFHVSPWLPKNYFDELTAEIKDPKKGRWVKIRARNEGLDLWVASLAMCEELGYGAKGRLTWESPPPWALPLDAGNSEVITHEEGRAERAAAKSEPKASAQAQSSPFASEEWLKRW